MCGCRRLARASLEVHDCDDLKVFTIPSMGHIFRRAVLLVEDTTDQVHVIGTVEPSSIGKRGGDVQLSCQLAKIGLANANEGCCFARRELADCLCRRGRENARLMKLQLPLQLLRIGCEHGWQMLLFRRRRISLVQHFRSPVAQIFFIGQK